MSMASPTLVSEFIAATFRRWTLFRPCKQAPPSVLHDDASEPPESTLLEIGRRVGEASDQFDNAVTCPAARRFRSEVAFAV
jgi:hypothetical protein